MKMDPLGMYHKHNIIINDDRKWSLTINIINEAARSVNDALIGDSRVTLQIGVYDSHDDRNVFIVQATVCKMLWHWDSVAVDQFVYCRRWLFS
jgi:hypothetical protein